VTVYRSFQLDRETAAGMSRARDVDWNAVVALAIRFKLKLLRQTPAEPLRNAPEARSAPMARPTPTAVLAKPAKPRRRREADPSPEEILRRAAEIRAAR
jgi:hypothetical protein